MPYITCFLVTTTTSISLKVKAFSLRPLNMRDLFCRCSLLNWGNSLFFLICWEFVPWFGGFCKLPFLQQLVSTYYFNYFPVEMVGYNDLFWDSQSCILEINSSWSWCIIISVHCWILFANILLKCLHISSCELSVYSFPFS